MKTKCQTPGCNNEAKNGRTICNACKKRRWVENHYIYYLFDNLRHNAKRRRKEFGLTYDEFVKFCNETNYHVLKGQTAESLTIDRKDPNRGYFYDNIRAITLSDNVHYEMDPDWVITGTCPF